MSTPPPPAPGQAPLPAPGSLRCPRCSATVGPDQDWCLECGAPARTRLAQTPNWRLPTVAIGAIILIAGAMLAFAFVKLTDDGGAPAGTTPTAAATAPIPPAVVAPVPATTPAAPTTTPTTPAATAPVQTTPTTPTAPATTPATPAPTPTTGGAPPPPLAPRTVPTPP